jgi:GAF domain-containing protein
VERFRSVAEAEEVTEERASESPTVQIGRRPVEGEARSIEDLLGDLFEATQTLYDHDNLEAAARFVLDLAHEAIPSESGAVFISDINRDDLYFAAATGPKADEVMSFRVPMGQGIVGFAAQEGVSVAVSDVDRDPRFYANISKALGYQTRSILCAPAQIEGRVFGALELINKRTDSSFSADEVNLLNYLAHELADYMVNTGQTGD